MKRLALFSCAIFLSALTIFSQTVTIDKDLQYQKIEGFGAFGGMDVPWSPDPWYDSQFLDDLIDDLGLTILRMEVSNSFEVNNDNDDSLDLNLSGFNLNSTAMCSGCPCGHQPLSRWIDYLNAIQTKADNSGEELKVIASIWTPPYWMKYVNCIHGTDHTWNRLIVDEIASAEHPPDRKTEFGEHCAGFVKTIKQETGIDLYGLSIQNEPFFAQTYQSCVYGYDVYKEVLKTTADRFDTEGISNTKFFGHEDVQVKWRIMNYYSATMSDTAARNDLDIFAVHGYGNDGASPGDNAQNWIDIYDAALEYNKQLWMTETSGYETTWDGALNVARSLHYALFYGKVSAWVFWTISTDTGDEFALMQNGTPTKKYYALKNYYRFIRPGAVMIDASSNDNQIMSTAYINPDDDVMTIVLINNDSVNSKNVNLSYLGSNTPSQFDVYRTSSTEDCAYIGTTNSSSVSLPAESITTLTSSTPGNENPMAPTIITQPQDQSVMEGDATAFSVEVTGTPDLTFQWKENGVAIPAETGRTLKLSAIELTDDGNTYSVDITNAAGSVTSANATLSVAVYTGTELYNVSTPINIDGVIDDVWNNQPGYDLDIINLGTVTDSNDLSATWRAVWDTNYLYFLIDVTDEAKAIDDNMPWADDGIEMFIDADNSKGNGYDGVNDFQWGFIRGDNNQIFIGSNSVNDTTGIDFAFDSLTNRYSMELAIPFSTLGITPTPNHIMGIEIQVDDDDDGGTRDAKKAWHDSTENAWQDPSVFGTAQLRDVPADDTIPPTPPSSLITTDVSQNSVDLAWGASTDNVAVGVYHVYQDGVQIQTVSGTVTSVSGLTVNTTYNYTVIASDVFGNLSDSSNAVIVTTSDEEVPTDPTSLNASGITETSVDLTWSASSDNVGVDQYIIYQDGNPVDSTSATSITISSLNAATNYDFTVTAKDAAGNESGQSNTESITTPDNTAPSAPSGLISGTITETSIALSWNASTDNVGVDHYNVYVDGSLETTTSSLSYTVSGLSPATTYNFHVTAEDAAGNESGNSNTLSESTPDNTAPTDPTNLVSGTITETSVALSWDASSDNVGVDHYNVYVDGGLNATSGSNSYTVTGLSPSVNYDFYVTAEDVAGNESGQSNTENATTPDNTSPSAPSGLAATDTTISSISINWNASTDNVGVTGYNIYIDGSYEANTVNTNYTITGLSAGITYQIYVTAEDAANNESGQGNIINIPTKTEADTNAPTAPASLTATDTTETDVDLVWYSSTDNDGIDYYTVFVNGTPSSNTTDTIFTVTGLNPSTSYDFYITATDSTGNESPPGNTVTLTTPDNTDPSAPASLASGTVTESSMALSWNAASDNVGVDHYNVYVDGSLETTTTNLTYTVTGLSPGTAYDFYVTAEDVAGNESAQSNTVNETTTDVTSPTNPTALDTANLSQSSVNLSWNASTDNVGVDRYIVYLDGSAIDSVDAPTTSYALSGLTVVTSYSVRITAKDAVGNESSFSNTVTFITPDETAPNAPSNLAYSNLTQSSVDLTWDAATDNVGVDHYNVYKDGVFEATSTLTEYTVTGLSASANYQFYVTAVDTSDNESGQSNTVMIITSDTEPPQAPASLSADTIKQNSVYLAWDAATDNVGIDRYLVYQNGVAIDSTADLNFTVSSLLASTGYNFYVTAKDASGNESAISNAVNITTTDEEPPTPPSNLVASNVQAKSLDLTWDPATDNVAVTAYDIYMDGGYKAYSSNNSAHITLAGAGIYEFYVIARDAENNNSEPSDTITVNTTDTIAPSAPSNVVIDTFTQSTAQLSWDAATDNMGIDEYRIYQNDVMVYSTSSLSGTVTGLDALNEYAFYIVAVDHGNNSSINSDTLTISTPDQEAPVAPANLAAQNITQTALSLAWSSTTDNVGVTGYTLFMNDSMIAELTDTTYTITGLTAGTDYAFSVIASDNAGNVSDSSSVDVTTLVGIESVITAQDILIYPNPSNTGKLFIELPANNNFNQIKINDMNGKTIITKQISRDEINMEINIKSLNGKYIAIFYNKQYCVYKQFIVIK